jgi:triacylglycerol lipase
MLAWLLRAVLVVEVAVLASLHSAAVARFGVVGAVLVLAAGLLVVPTMLLGLGYGIAARHASPRPPGVGPLRLGDALGEWLAFVVGFVVVMPFANQWMGSDAVGRLAPGRRPVLLVHGYMCNRGFWWWMRRELRARGFAVATIDLETPFSDIEHLADGLDRRIDALLAETGADRVLLVTHSMGGLVARALLRRDRADRIARFVTLGGPHHGTVTARLGLGRNARQMEPGNAWLAELNRVETTAVPTLTIWSCGDQIVAPQATSRLIGAREVVLPGLGHMALATSREVRDLVVADLVTDAGRA